MTTLLNDIDARIQEVFRLYGEDGSTAAVTGAIRKLIEELSQAETGLGDRISSVQSLLTVVDPSSVGSRGTFRVKSVNRSQTSPEQWARIREAIFAVADELASRNNGFATTKEIESEIMTSHPEVPKQALRVRAGNFLHQDPRWAKVSPGLYQKN